MFLACFFFLIILVLESGGHCHFVFVFVLNFNKLFQKVKLSHALGRQMRHYSDRTLTAQETRTLLKNYRHFSQISIWKVWT